MTQLGPSCDSPRLNNSTSPRLPRASPVGGGAWGFQPPTPPPPKPPPRTPGALPPHVFRCLGSLGPSVGLARLRAPFLPFALGGCVLPSVRGGLLLLLPPWLGGAASVRGGLLLLLPPWLGGPPRCAAACSSCSLPGWVGRLGARRPAPPAPLPGWVGRLGARRPAPPAPSLAGWGRLGARRPAPPAPSLAGWAASVRGGLLLLLPPWLGGPPRCAGVLAAALPGPRGAPRNLPNT
jgi:hypothetical protein